MPHSKFYRERFTASTEGNPLKTCIPLPKAVKPALAKQLTSSYVKFQFVVVKFLSKASAIRDVSLQLIIELYSRLLPLDTLFRVYFWPYMLASCLFQRQLRPNVPFW